MKSEWKTYMINDICSNVYSGGTPSKKHDEYYNGGKIPWLNTSEIKFNRIYSTGKKITDVGLSSSSAKWVPKNTVIVAMYGATAAKVAISKIPLTTNQACCNLLIDEYKADYRYVYYWLYSKYTQLASLANGGAQQNLNTRQIKNFPISIPTISVQNKISSILSAIDDKIELNNAINENLERQAEYIFDSMFPNIMFGNKTIGDYITPKRGKSLLSKNAISGDVPVVAGGLEASTYHNIANTKAPVITISASGANAGFVNLWHIPVWSSDSSFIDSSMTKDVFFWYIILKKRQKEIFDSQTGSAQPHIYPKHIAIMKIAEINNNQIISFTKQVTPLFNLIGTNIKQNEKLAKLRDALLPKLMSGEINVSNVNI